jgi:zona occludens toxin (predicted ATPase)
MLLRFVTSIVHDLIYDSIISYKTKKVLFVGIQNRYCMVCKRATNRKIEIPNHFCFLKWKQGATNIEANVIVKVSK